MSGTKPYMAPEVFQSAMNPHNFRYSFAVDWWSLGITAYELRSGRRPLDIHSRTSANAVINLVRSKTSPETNHLRFSRESHWSEKFVRFLKALLTVDQERRTSTLEEVKQLEMLANVDFEDLKEKTQPPPFVPASETLNCDPTYELEEMIVESKPLHKKKKRLLKQQTLMTQRTTLLEKKGSCPNFPTIEVSKLQF